MQSTSEDTPAPAISAISAIGQRHAALLARLTIAGTLLYVVLDVIAQVLPPHYSPISQAESDLAVGPYGYVMTINFVIRGLLGLAVLWALVESAAKEGVSRFGLITVGIWSVGALLLALFPTDLAGQTPTLHGILHLTIALLAFLGGAIGELLLSLSFGRVQWLRSLKRLGVVISVLAIIALLLLGSAARVHALQNVGGLIERLFIGLVLLWMLVVALGISTLRARTALRI